jgi:hypothetical protein
MSRVVSDRWYWLRRQADLAHARYEQREEVKHLDRLIGVEPIWQNYDRRARVHRDALVEAARDVLEAGKRAGEGYWHREESVSSPAGPLIIPATHTRQEYEMGLQLAEALSRAIPEDRDRRLLLAVANYRVGRYAEVLPLLKDWQHERERALIFQVGQFFLLGGPAALLKRPPVQEQDVWATVFQAMTYHRLGQGDRARASLRAARTDAQALQGGGRYRDLLREAETLIEGRPPPGK